jgi:23S rRNA-/tRNA-specific pseudouridylate synthase
VQAESRSITPLNRQEHLKIVWEDDHLIVVDKPSGILCVPGLNSKPNLLHLVRDYLVEQHEKKQHQVVMHDNDSVAAKQQFPSAMLFLEKDPSKMIVHRLDMDTSGVVVFAKTELSMKLLQAKFRDRSRDVNKEYHALVCGHFPLEWQNGGDILLPLQRDHRHPPFMRIATPRSEEEATRAVKDLQTHGFQKLVKKRPKPSHTEFRVLGREWLQGDDSTERNKIGKLELPVTRVLLIPHTGRTHQLRVHMSALGYPILGDPAYGLYGEASERGGCDVEVREEEGHPSPCGVSLEVQMKLLELWPPPEKQMCLHAARLCMLHPITNEEMEWNADAPF